MIHNVEENQVGTFPLTIIRVIKDYPLMLNV